MQIPTDLQQNIESFFESSSPLQAASIQLTKRYHNGLSLKAKEEILAYLVVRLPATYAALYSVLSQLSPPHTLLDLGAGPATAYWVAQSLWPTLTITAIEKETHFIELGRALGADVTWKQENILHTSLEPHDWILFSYSLGEIASAEYPSLLKKCWEKANKGLIIIEPGTPRGYHNILQARTLLTSFGAFIQAPCPHSRPCPLAPSDWCHFSARVERTQLHRLAKQGSLSYEDEKFSYLIVTKETTPPSSRILRPPLHRSGHTLLPLCTSDGLATQTIARSNKSLYKKARKATWGDRW